jgi:hypothetical protein
LTRKRKKHSLKDTTVPSDPDDDEYEDIIEVVDYALLFKNNPIDYKKATEEVI